MQFSLSEDQKLLAGTTRRFLEDRHPLAALRPRLDAPSTLDRDVWVEGAALGWTAMLVPEAYDGGSITDQPVVDLAALAGELGRGLYPGPLLATNVVADAITREADDDQHKEHLGPIARGELIAAWCLTADGTAEIDRIGVRATLDGSSVVLEGVARFVHDAHEADLLLVACAADGGPTNVIVARETVGVTVRILRSIDVTRRFCEVRFANVRVPTSGVLGTVGGAAAAIERSRRLGTVLQAAEAVGLADRIFGMTVQYAKDRIQFGRAIGSFQAIKHRLADLLIELEGARAGADYAALAVSDHLDDEEEAVAVAGSFVRDAAAHICGEAVQIHGGIGFTWEHDAHLFLRRAKADQVLLGDPAWHRERLCAQIEATVTEAS